MTSSADGGGRSDGSWSLHVLAEVLAAFSVDDPDAVHRVVDRVAEAVDAEVVVVVQSGRVTSSVGVDQVAEAALLAATSMRPPLLGLPSGVPHRSGTLPGLCLYWSPLDGEDVMAVGRFGEAFDIEERSLLRAMGRSMALSLRAVAAVEAERRARDELDRALVAATHRASHDQLTGLPARDLVLEAIEHRLESLDAAERDRLCVFFLDVDRFKQVNDAHGHAIGDQFLVALAHRIRSTAGSGDLVGRLAGDEFVVVSSCPTLEVAEARAAAILRVLVDPLDIDGRLIMPSVSIGISRGARSDHAESLVDDADLAMYRAKQAGRGRVVVFDPSLRHSAEQRAAIESDLRQALRGPDEFRCFFQPVVELASLRPVGFEALVRWAHPTRGLVPPDEFIPVAEETGQIVDIDARMLRAACARLAEWRRRPGCERLTVSVNASARTFADPLLPSRVAEALDLSGVPSNALFLEITESVMMDEGAGNSETMQRLVDLGVRLVVDDFGTGYSSLRYLKQFPVAVLKVDRSFVAQLGQNREDEAIVESVVGLAGSLGLTVTAEGVETQQQLDRLVELECAYGQGYLFGRPQSADDTAQSVLPAADVPS